MNRIPLPVRPVLSFRSLFPLFRGEKAPSLLEAGPGVNLNSGRVALVHAMQALGVQKGDRVLVPAYHCPSMVEPIEFIGAKPEFYRVTDRAEIDFEDLQNKAQASGASVLIAAHYFGFMQDVKRLREFAEQAKISVIEDCAHTFFGSRDGIAVGQTGEFTIASTKKFFPLFDGGRLITARRELPKLSLESAGLFFEAKVCVNILERAFAAGRLGLLRLILSPLFWMKEKAQKRPNVQATQSEVKRVSTGAAEGSYKFEPEWLFKRMAFGSRLVLFAVNKKRVSVRRRENYCYLAAQLEDVEGACALFPELDKNTVPYLLPVMFKEAEKVLAGIVRDQTPFQRFGFELSPLIDEQTCPNTMRLSQHTIQFPVHHELTLENMQVIADSIKQAVSDA